MTTAAVSLSALTNLADLVYPSVGTIGQVILLKPDLTADLTFIPNPLTSELTTTTPHGLITGSRFRINAINLPPTGLSTLVDYYAIVTAPQVVKPAISLAAALASVYITFTDTGTGSLTLNEQQLSVLDSPSVLIAKELASASGRIQIQRLALWQSVQKGNQAQITVVRLKLKTQFQYR